MELFLGLRFIYSKKMGEGDNNVGHTPDNKYQKSGHTLARLHTRVSRALIKASRNPGE